MEDTDLETCSWCLEEVPDSTLRSMKGGDGARVCAECRIDGGDSWYTASPRPVWIS